MVNQITMLYALSLHSAASQSYPNKTGRNKKRAPELEGRKKKKAYMSSFSDNSEDQGPLPSLDLDSVS